MRTTLWLSSVFALCLAACGGSTPTPTPTPDVPIVTDNPVLPTDTGPTPTDTARPDVRVDTGPADAGPPSRAGAACTMGGNECGDALDCAPVGARGFCTSQCDDGTVAMEQAQCGGRGSTCLTQGDGTTARSQCTRACNPTARSEATGQCRVGTVCTGWWYTHAMGADDPGCFPFCGAATDCAGMTPVCNVRTGSCAATGVDMARLPDGSGCNPMMTVMVPGEMTPRNIQCRGICFGVTTANRAQGICGSFLNLGAADTTGCPDSPDQVQPRAPMGDDNLGICIFRNCESDCDCLGGLSCIYPEQMGMPVTTAMRLCQHPTMAQRTGVACTRDGGTDVTPTDATPTDVSPTDVVSTDVSPTDVVSTDAGAETLYVATLNGGEEVPSVVTAATGTAQVFLNSARNSIRYVVRHTVMGATAAHIHIGMAGQNGAVAIALSGFGADITGTSAVTPEQVTALDQDRWYFNVHTTANPGGEVRGQVLRMGETLYVASLNGAQEVPAVTTTQTGIGSIIVSADRMSLRYRVESMLMPSAAHVHTGPGGVAGGVAFGIMPLGTVIAGTQAVAAPVTLADLERGRWYFNLHTTANPGGEIRGQILRPGEVLFTSALSGASEVPPVVSVGAGAVAAILSADRTRVSVDGAFMGLVGVSAAHLHSAPAGMNGGVSFPLTVIANDLSGTLTVSASMTMGFLDALLANGVYANVHTALHAGGELRGQLTRR